MTQPRELNKAVTSAVRPMRAVERMPFTATVQFRKGQVRVNVQIVDISTLGARLSAVHHLREGDTFWLKLATLAPQEAVVIWSDEFIVGCKFVQPLQPYVLDNVLRTSAGQGY